MEEEKTKKYTLTPTYKKSVCDTEYWTRNIDDKTVTISVNNVYRWGDFTIELTDKDKDELLELDEINLSEYNYELDSMWDGGCDFWIDIQNEDKFSEEEKEKINNLIYQWQEPIQEDEDEDDDGYSYEKLEHNGWYQTDGEVTIGCKCELKEIE